MGLPKQTGLTSSRLALAKPLRSQTKTWRSTAQYLGQHRRYRRDGAADKRRERVTCLFNENTAGDLTTLELMAASLRCRPEHRYNATAVTTLNLGITSEATVAFAGVIPTLQTVDANKSTGDLTINVAARHFPMSNR